MGKKHLLLLPLLVGTIFSANLKAGQDNSYTIGIVPQFEIRHIRKIWSPILKEIKENTGITLKLIGSPTIPDFEQEFTKGRFDFAYMNPYHMLLAQKSQGYLPLVRDNGRKLYGILVVRKDGEIKSIKDLEGKKIAFPAPNSLGASLLMRANLSNEHKINYNPVYVKTHSSVYLNVIVKQTDAGGGVQKTLNQQKINIRSTLKVLHKTPYVASHPLSAHPRVPRKIREKVKQAFIQLGESLTGQALLSKIPIKKIGNAKMSDYTPLKKLKLENFYVH